MVGAVGLFLGHALRMEGAGKLVPMTYLLVVVNNVEEGPAESYALYRFVGIVVGMLIAQVTATAVFQRSATEDVLDRLRSSLSELAELNRLVWGNQKKLAALEYGGEGAEEQGDQSGGGGPRLTEEQQLEGFQARINAALNGALASLPLTATECRVIGGPLAAWWFVPWPRSCPGGAAASGCCGGARRSCRSCCCGGGAKGSGGWQLDQALVSRTVGCIRRVNRLQCSFWLLLSHPPADPAIRHDPALIQLLKDFRFLTQAVVDGVLAAATHLRGVDADALVHLNSKILDSPRLVAIGAAGGGGAGGAAGGYSSGAGGGGGSSTAGGSGSSASASGHLSGLLGSGGLLGGTMMGLGAPGGGGTRRPSRSPSPSPQPASMASAAAAVAAAAMATVASAVRVGGGGGGGGGSSKANGGDQSGLSEPLLPAASGNCTASTAAAEGGQQQLQQPFAVAPPPAPLASTPFGSVQSTAGAHHVAAASSCSASSFAVPGAHQVAEPTRAISGGGGGGAPGCVLVVGGPCALDEEEGKEDDASSVFHRPPLQYMPTGLAGFERSAMTPEVWWHTFQFLLTQLAAEVSAMQEAVSQLVRTVKA
ncbi:hypothetical protein HYH02_003002 [Chlamydomonas schloesseri]|uniref:Uncharacterized protein n=1 Tax=Chlamydomonas schloesseri TaxID=2026947 RepID=A0A835WRV6_9CHLO|nr:hypothetical protein HYH02_003002 [Chlamydomonas schloesseri]|eukprot:KAG2452772.1 hypothetical protein HYH02_003002 [Chlamydomonas schloesseri]